MRTTFFLGALTGLLVSLAILTLMWFGVSGVLHTGRADLMYIFWPSSIVLLTSWRTTPVGITITLFSVIVNCVLYGGAALIVRFLVRQVAKLVVPT